MATISWSTTVRCYSFSIITFHIYIILVTKWKHIIVPNDIFTFNEELEILSMSVIELVYIDESSHEESIVIFITKTEFKKKNGFITEDEDGNFFEFSYSEKS